MQICYLGRLLMCLATDASTRGGKQTVSARKWVTVGGSHFAPALWRLWTQSHGHNNNTKQLKGNNNDAYTFATTTWSGTDRPVVPPTASALWCAAIRTPTSIWRWKKCKKGDGGRQARVWEEAGVAVVLRGILRVEHSMNRHGARQRVVFYAEPTDPDNGTTKQVADLESLRAEWLTVDELRAKEALPPPHGLRGPELLQWATYVERGGLIFPLHVFTDECAPIPTA